MQRLIPLSFQCISEPVSIVAPVGQQAFRLRQAAEESGGPTVVTDLACGHDEADWSPIGIGEGVQLGVHAALGSTD